ncbi:TPA: isoleucine--tRNA ligase [Candidatus Nomurabacteria bacterium]|nr:MAG: isoleucyl-tRNA synthetase [Parcubacteria bacterium RAAC4_OD1_1]HCY26364.1 isoleucine--tRNA ligase [Candidatus Nomurabacteria bacterium]
MNEEIKSQRAQNEEKILEFWKENNIFQKSLEKDAPKGEYVFYEGPPTANGKPGIHHLEARAFKDAIPRYKTMKGYHVRRKGGWDTHGLPVELQVEKKLGLTSKKAIEEYGISKFNHECKESVWEYTDIWEKFTDRIGYWVDQKNAYVTYHNDYIESVWNIIKNVNDQGLLFKDYKVVPWCPRCGTTLSSHELAQGYQDVKDLSVYAKFKIKGQENTYILAWTTTPWTLPGNVALAVGKDIDYVKIKKENEIYILAKARLSTIEGEYEILEEFKGSDLVGLEYEPLYPFLKDTISDSEKNKLEKAFKVYPADFVTTEDGTGVVHTAVMYGQDDFVLGNEIGLPKHHLVGLDGKFLPGTGFLEGRFVRPARNADSIATAGGDEETAVEIIKDLAHRGLLFKKEKYEHSYPHCWRCKTALIYYARDSWYIKMSALRDKLVEENKGINWEPSYIKEGRFGEWLSDIKDWAISRERYWGTPLPVWKCEKCNKIEVIRSLEDLKNKTKKSGNKYFVMRHGEADNNLTDLVSTSYNNEDHLTENGKNQVKENAENLKDKNIDFIFTSPFVRARETSEIVQDVIGLEDEKVIVDDRLHEMSLPMYEGRTWTEYHKDYPNTVETFYHGEDGNESYNDMKRRIMSFLYEMEDKYSGKNILIVTHGGPSWLAVAGSMGLNGEESLKMIKDYNYLKNAEWREVPFYPIPHDENYELDLHRPYIDEVELQCECSGKLERSKEVMDVWLDSGTMPFSQDHYPFDGEINYPADFISEAIDQTRGWFYTLHAVGVLMGRGKAYKNVICLGHILDANGKKMSKSLGNIVDPWEMIHKYGADTLRMWMYSVNQPGESKNFDEKTVSELHNKVFNLLYNVLAFYELYRDKELESREKALPLGGPRQGLEEANVLDQWILVRFAELAKNITEGLENYKLLEPVRSIRDFIDDLSTWYLRRSRERIKDEASQPASAQGYGEARQTLYFVLKNLAKLMAPFAPFASEDIWQKLRNDMDEESVHLANWPEIQELKDDLNQKMEETRRLVSLGLESRQKNQRPVRQVLNSMIINDSKILNESDIQFIELIKEEVNVKKIYFGHSMNEISASVIKTITIDMSLPIQLDTEITPELKQEGNYRELVRAVQDMRKKMGLNPNDVVNLEIETGVEGQKIINRFEKEFEKAVSAKVSIKENEGEEIKIGDILLKIDIKI